MKYRLAPLRIIRDRRQAEAERNLAQARNALARRQQELGDREKELADYIAWCEAESIRLFSSIQNKAIAHHEIVAISDQIGWNRGRTSLFIQKVDEAKSLVETAAAHVAEAESHLQETTRQLMKIQEHEAEWNKTQRASAEAAEEAELEEAASTRFLRKGKVA
jgi:hypothetical protein